MKQKGNGTEIIGAFTFCTGGEPTQSLQGGHESICIQKWLASWLPVEHGESLPARKTGGGTAEARVGPEGETREASDVPSARLHRPDQAQQGCGGVALG